MAKGGVHEDKVLEKYRITADVDPRSFWLAATPSTVQLTMPYVCTEAGILYGRSKFVTGRTTKESYLLLYTFGGAGYVRQGGRTVTVSHGQGLLMDCRAPQEYGTLPQRNHWYHLWAHVEGAGVDAAARRLGLPKLAPVSLASSRMKPHFEALFERIRTESVENEELASLAVHALLSELVMARAREEVPQDDPVTLACAFVAEHYSEAITVKDMARAASVSSGYLTRLFRKTLDTTPHDYLVRHRITQAKQLLIETDEPIGTVAKRSGFASESNFSYRFSQMCDITPRAYRSLRFGSAV